MSKADAAIQYAQRLDQHVPTWRVAAQLPAELLEHTAGSAPPELAAAGGGGGDNPEEEQEGQSFDMGPTVSRLDVDALSPEDEAARNSNASAVLLAVEDADATALRSALAKSPADANAKVSISMLKHEAFVATKRLVLLRTSSGSPCCTWQSTAAR